MMPGAEGDGALELEQWKCVDIFASHLALPISVGQWFSLWELNFLLEILIKYKYTGLRFHFFILS